MSFNQTTRQTSPISRTIKPSTKSYPDISLDISYMFVERFTRVVSGAVTWIIRSKDFYDYAIRIFYTFCTLLNMMTSSNGNIFRVTGYLCGEFTGQRWIPRTKASGAELWCFFDLRLNKRLSKQSLGWWFETPSRPLWRHCNEFRLKNKQTHIDQYHYELKRYSWALYGKVPSEQIKVLEGVHIYRRLWPRSTWGNIY